MLQFMLFFLMTVLSMAPASAQGKLNAEAREKLKKEIFKVEQDFQRDLEKNGVAYAFEQYAADDAVIKRENDSLITGKAAIKNYYSNPGYKNAVAVWAPDFIDVSDDGSMAYTYGKYTWTFTDKEGKRKQYSGVFHTVWKRMADGSWKYVWD